MPVSKLNLSILPSAPGVYLMKDKQGAVLYVGKAINIKKRVAQYFSGREEQTRGWKIAAMMPLISQIDFVVCASERDALLLENKLIKQYKPFFNSMLKDDKSYSYLKLTVGEDYPRLMLTRKKIKDKSLYFGPYPKAYNIKQLLHFLRRSGFAPLRQCSYSFSRQKPLAENKIQGCIYFHTGQCSAPCAKISYDGYRQIVKRVALFLDGNFKQAKHELEGAMKAASKNLNYEEAAKCRDLISALEQMGERIKVSKYCE
ncbi:MAG: GIY-YIG nuclease family protein, partial [Elusimicrobiaceae bacterium]|nr:GIY-YIG nuclease family protein [Elusimicrobiaceae bacterium]